MRIHASILGLLIAGTLSAAPPARPNVLLIVVDTLRYDATQNNTMPFLASLAPNAVVFSRAYSTHDFTPTSHFSIFTGLHDGLGTDDDRVENGVAYQLQRAGYQTFATIANTLLAPAQMPTARGFTQLKLLGINISTGSALDDVRDLTDADLRLRLFRCAPNQRNLVKVHYSASVLLPVFLEQIEQAKPPYFGFVNLLDVHEPYIPDPQLYPPERSLPPNFDGDVVYRRLPPELRHPETISDPTRRAFVMKKIAQAGAPWQTTLDLSPAAVTIYHNRYNAQARSVDDVLRQFFDAMKRKGLLDNTVVIITSDHGESFGEDGLITHMFHDRGDYEVTHHVPMIVVFPPSMGVKPRTIGRTVSIANLAPTIYDLAGLDRAPLRARYATYPRSLLRAVGVTEAVVASVDLPKPSKQDHTLALQEREKAMRSLGYVH